MANLAETKTCEACQRRGYQFCHRPLWHGDPSAGLNMLEDALNAVLKRIGKLELAIVKVPHLRTIPWSTAAETICGQHKSDEEREGCGRIGGRCAFENHE
jgi:hypothetical protein